VFTQITLSPAFGGIFNLALSHEGEGIGFPSLDAQTGTSVGGNAREGERGKVYEIRILNHRSRGFQPRSMCGNRRGKDRDKPCPYTGS